MVPLPRLEPGTPKSTIWCSNQLSYSGVCKAAVNSVFGQTSSAQIRYRLRENAPVSRLRVAVPVAVPRTAIAGRYTSAARLPFSLCGEVHKPEHRVMHFGEECLEVAGRIGLLSGLGDKPGKLLGLLREGLHLLARELALNIERLFQVFRMNEALSELEICLEVGFGVLHGLLVNLTSAGRDNIGGFGHDFLSLAGGLDEAVISFVGLLDALAGKVANGCGNSRNQSAGS